MEPNRRERIHKALSKRLAAEARQTLSQARALFRDPPERMQYFYDVFSRWADPPAFCDARRPVIATTCTQVPLELILACNARPLRLCNGSHALEQAGAELLPAKACTLVKAAAGMLSVFQEELRRQVSLVVVPAMCDQKRKAAETLAELNFPVYAMEVPTSKDTAEADFYWQDSVKKLALRLGQVTGTRITRRRLAGAVRTVQAASAEFRRLYGLQQNDPPPLHGTDLFLVTNAFLYDDIARWTAAAAQLNAELQHRMAHGRSAGRPAARILLTGSPPAAPGLKLPLLVEATGAVIVADEVCSCSRLLYDALPPVEPGLYDLLPALADRYLKPCTCPVFNSSRDRERKLLEQVRRFRIDGIVYPVYSGCQLYQMEQRPIGAALRKANVPVLFIETDASPEDQGQLATRIEAFVEAIQANQKGAKPWAYTAASTSVRQPSRSCS